MTHSNLLRVFSYLGFRANRKNRGTTSIAFFPALIPVVLLQRRTQSVDDRSTLWQLYRCTKGDSRSRLSIAAMGQASSVVRGADENADRSKDGIASANPSNDVNEGVVSADAEKAIVSPEQTLTSKQASKPAATEDAEKEVDTKAIVKKEVEIKANLVLLDELGDPPERPLAGDCCGQGCDICVWDTYNDELRDYLARKKALLAKKSNK